MARLKEEEVNAAAQATASGLGRFVGDTLSLFGVDAEVSEAFAAGTTRAVGEVGSGRVRGGMEGLQEQLQAEPLLRRDFMLPATTPATTVTTSTATLPTGPAAASMADRIREAGERMRERATADKPADKATEQRQQRETAEARDPLRERGDRVAESLRTAAEEFAARMAELNQLLAAGAIDQETFDRAADQATQDRQAREQAEARDPLREEGQRLAESLRTAAEWLEAEVAELDRLRAAGAIDDETYQRALARTNEEAERRKELENRATGAAEATVQEAEAYAALAKGALRTLPPSRYRDALEDLADFCVSRAY
jgi:hypothetical protein